MMKNTVKLMMTVTLIIGLGMSAFIKPAEAQRRRRSNTYSETSTDATNIILQFSLVDTTLDGNSIVFDKDPDNNIGIFEGVIENLTLARTGRLTETGGQYDPFGNLQFDEPFLPQETLLAEGDLRAEFISNDPIFSGQSTIRYSILNPGTDEVVQITDSESPSGILPLEFILFPESNPLAQDKKAINSLSYILSNNLLGESSGGSARRVLSNAPIQEEDVPSTAVPESDTTIASLLGLGVLSAGSLLKRKMKPS